MSLFSTSLNVNGCRIYMDIMSGEKLSSIKLANMVLIDCSVCSFRRRGGGVKVVEGGNRYCSLMSVSLC